MSASEAPSALELWIGGVRPTRPARTTKREMMIGEKRDECKTCGVRGNARDLRHRPIGTPDLTEPRATLTR